ncbi:hypothetical protein B0H16DRAFT_1602311, partial [Mycena metata]
MFILILILSSAVTTLPNTNAYDESFIAHHTSPLRGFYRQPSLRSSAHIRLTFARLPEYFSSQPCPFNNRYFNRASSRF